MKELRWISLPIATAIHDEAIYEFGGLPGLRAQGLLESALDRSRDPQYDHEVSVLKIGTSHSPDDVEYYDDDVLYFEDHGAYTLTHVDDQWAFAWNPSVPYGAG